MANEQAAYEAGYEEAKKGLPMSYASWRHHWYTCQDCHRDTESETVHRCPVRQPHPYRAP